MGLPELYRAFPGIVEECNQNTVTRSYLSVRCDTCTGWTAHYNPSGESFCNSCWRVEEKRLAAIRRTEDKAAKARRKRVKEIKARVKRRML